MKNVRQSVDVGAREAELFGDRVGLDLELLLERPQSLVALVHCLRRPRNFIGRRQRRSLRGERLERLEVTLGVAVLRARVRDLRFELEALRFERRLQRDVVLLRARHGALRVEHLELHVRVAQLQQQRRWRDGDARPNRKHLDAARSHGDDVANVLGRQRARRADLSRHGAALNGIDPERCPIDRRRALLEISERDGGDAEDGDTNANQDVFAALFQAVPA